MKNIGNYRLSKFVDRKTNHCIFMAAFFKILEKDSKTNFVKKQPSFCY